MWKNLYEFYKDRCELFSSNIIFNNTITYAEAFQLVEQRIAFLQAQGYKKGDVIGLLAQSNYEWVITYMAITSIGAIVLPLDTNLPANTYPEMLKKLNTRAVFISDEFKKTLKGIKTFSVSINKSIDKNTKIKIPAVKETDPACYLFTSGTTGTPKIVMLTHKNIFATARSTAEVVSMSERDVMLCILPLYHVYALDACFVGPFVAGSSFIYQTSLKGPDIMKSLADHPITIFPAAPILWEMFMDAILNRVKAESNAKYKLFTFFLEYGNVLRKIGLGMIVNKIFDPVHEIFGRSHRFFISGGAPLKDKYRKYYRNMGFTLIEGYGLSETTGPIMLSDVKNNIIGSVGKATPGNEAKIKNINEDGIGEVWLRGDSVMPGYYKNEKENKKVFDEDGFYNTGDLGRMDKDGNLFLTGRVKNVIVLSSGKNVYPEELESFYKQSPLIEEIAVFGLEKSGTEKVYAVIVPVEKNAASYSKIKSEIEKLNKGLPGYKAVTDFAISFDKLPANSARKIVYREIIDLLNQGVFQESENDSATLLAELEGTTQEENIIVEYLKEKMDAKTLYAKESLADMGLDSLALVDLTVFLEEKLKISIDLEKMKSLNTLEEVLQYLSSLDKGSSTTISQRLFEGEITEKPLKILNPVLYFWIGIIKFVCHFILKTKIVNKEKLLYENCIMMANHCSYLDLILMVYALPVKAIKNTYAIGNIKVSIIRFIFPKMPVIWIDPSKNTNEIFKRSADLLRQGKSIMIFPEGTRTKTGTINEFKQGAAFLAKNIGKKILPIAITGTFDVWPPDKKFPSLFSGKNTQIVAGNTIDPDKYKSVEALNKKMYNEIKGMLDKEIN
ncbi:MAG: AMP-binding protein [Spirochaetota bacterium]